MLFIPPLTEFVLAGVPADRVGPASGALTSLQQIGGALGVTIIGLVFFRVLDSRASARNAAATAYTDAFVAGLVVEALVFAFVIALVPALPRRPRRQRDFAKDRGVVADTIGSETRLLRRRAHQLCDEPRNLRRA